jgi:hypothetical protein
MEFWIMVKAVCLVTFESASADCSYRVNVGLFLPSAFIDAAMHFPRSAVQNFQYQH